MNSDLIKPRFAERAKNAYQNQGIASAICDELEQAFDGDKITAHASITAKPFFEKRGYKVIKKQEVERNGIVLTNYVMEKERELWV